MPEPSNLIFFMSDNHSASALGCYGNSIVQSPNLDRIASSGVRFRTSYAASAICCPSRASIATGRYPHQTRYWDNCLVYDGKIPSWMHRLRDQGHAVVSIGKLHFRSSEDDNGFSEEIAPMHIIDGIGAIVHLLRWNNEEPVLPGQWELYSEESGVGDSVYQDFDRKITRHAIDWLRKHGKGQQKPWVLFVSYPSVHPPFSVPKRLWDLYYSKDLPLPQGKQLEHPSLVHLRNIFGYKDLHDPEIVRRITAGYYALVTHLDEQVGEVIRAAEDLGLLDRTRVLYTSDHGESLGEHGLLGKFQLLESAIATPLLYAGRGIPTGRVVNQIVSSVDLFPTILKSCGAHLEGADADLPGVSLWDSIGGQEAERPGFAEYHAAGSASGSFLWREGDWKLLYHVDMQPQLFNLRDDPNESIDLVALGSGLDKAKEMERRLRDFVDPEEADRQAKADQKAKSEEFGGNGVIRTRGIFPYSPPPGATAKVYPTK